MSSRIYVVTDATVAPTDPEQQAHRLVRAGNPAQAIRHVVRGRFSAEVAGQATLVRLVAAGVGVEEVEA